MFIISRIKLTMDLIPDDVEGERRMKKKKVMALLLVGCMTFGQTVWAQDLPEENISKQEENILETDAEQISGEEETDIDTTVPSLKEQAQGEIVEDETEIARMSDAETVEVSAYIGKTRTIENHSVSYYDIDNWRIENDNPDICNAKIDWKSAGEETDSKYCDIEIEGLKEGTAKLDIYCGDEIEYSYVVKIQELPQDVVTFEDENLEKALLRFYMGVDTNNDGIITKEELGEATSLSLNAENIVSLSGLEYATNLENISLINNTGLVDVNALFDLKKLNYINLEGTGVSGETRFKLAKFKTEIEMTKGDAEAFVLNGDLFDDKIELTKEILEGNDNVVIKGSKIVAKEDGKSRIRLSCENQSVDISVVVTGIDADQEIGNASDSIVKTAAGDSILTNNNELWQLYPEKKKIKDHVERYVSGWVYGNGETVQYAHYLDSEGVLYSDVDKKLADNIAEIGGRYALDKNGALIDIYNTERTTFNDVSAWTEYMRTWPQKTTITYILKNDNTLWSKEEVEKDAAQNEFKKVADHVEMINDSGYILEGGGYISFYNNSKIENAVTFPQGGNYAKYYTGIDGHTYLNADNRSIEDLGEVRIKDTLLKYDTNYTDYYFYLTENGELYKYDRFLKTSTLVAKGVSGLVNNGFFDELIYIDEQGFYRRADGTYGTESNPIKTTFYGYVLKNIGVAGDYNLTKNDVLILTHVRELLKLDNAVLALRTDGTIWDITKVPEKLMDINKKESGTCGKDTSWSLNDGTLHISGSGTIKNYDSSTSVPWNKIKEQISTVVIDNGVTGIGDFAFYNLPNLTSVSIPESVTKIGNYAFKNCNKLETVELPDSLTEVGDSTFYGCTNMSSIVLPTSVNKIGEYAFARCTSVKEIVFEGKAPKIETGAFAKVVAKVGYPMEDTSWTEDIMKNYGGTLSWKKSSAWELKNGVLTIADDSCMKNYNKATEVPWYEERTQITSIVINDGITKVSDFAFYGCNNLSEISIPESVTRIGEYAFKNCEKLEEIVLPKSVTEIGNSAFYGCKGLTEIIIPEAVTKISDYAFSRSTALRMIKFEGSAPEIGEYVFRGVSADVNYPVKNESWTTDKKQNYGGYLKWAENGEKQNCGKNAFWKIDNDVIIIYGTGSMYNYDSAKTCPWLDIRENITKVVIEDGITSVGDFAFYGMKNLENIEFSNTLEKVGNYAFKNCVKLSSVELSNELTEIGESAFYGCANIKEITIPEKVTKIASYAFARCTGIKRFIFEGNAPKFGDYAFSKVNATVEYSAEDESWTENVKQNYGGTISWKEV